MKIEHLSVSRTQLWQECQLKYKFKYHLGLKSNFPEQPWFEYGKIIHKSAELFVEAKGETPIREFTEQILNGKIALEDGSEPKKIHLDSSYALRLGGHLRAIETITKHRLNYGGFIEWDFLFDLDQPNKKILKGFIDRLIPKKDGTYLVLDYKTTRKGPFRKDENSIKDDLQLQAYSMVVSETLNVQPQNILLALYYLDDQKLVQVRHNKETLDNCKIKLKTIYDKIADTEPERAVPTVGWGCNRCEYRDICPYSKKKT
jgi:RecB family exonuclease